jgi:hypothetical protein
MTKANSAQNIPNSDDDDTLPEYTFSGGGVRGRYAKTLCENGYSVTIHHQDGTSTTRYVSPSEVQSQNRQREYLQPPSPAPAMHEQNTPWIGDRVAGDKVAGDKVMGDKMN